MRMMPTAAAIAAMLAIAAGTALGQAGETPFEKRQAAMEIVGKSAKTVGDMLRGNAPFDAAAANEALAAMQEAVVDYGEFFPEGSEHPESEAAPAIWEDMDGFQSTLSAFREDLAAGVEAAPQTPETLGATFGEIAQNCRTCHEQYRIDKD